MLSCHGIFHLLQPTPQVPGATKNRLEILSLILNEQIQPHVVAFMLGSGIRKLSKLTVELWGFQ